MAEEKIGEQFTENQTQNTHQAGPVRAEPSQPVEYTLFESNQWAKKDAEVIVETPVSLTVNGEVWLTFMCTPVDLEALALGFLYNEGILTSMDAVAQVHVCAAGDNVDVWLDHAVEKPEKWRRTSGCTGGVTAVETERLPFELPAEFSQNGSRLSPAQVTGLVDMLFDNQELYRRSGGVHTSILTDGRSVLVVGEDIGRHNTLDKLAGRCLVENIRSTGRIVITTGRISSEMIQKAARLGASIVISRTSPSSLSVRLAERWGITMIGYARRNRFIVYTHPERIG
jgi:FdhD protein